MTYKPFKMKGSPMKRNFGIGAPNKLNNFGVGPGGSPYKNEEDKDTETTETTNTGTTADGKGKEKESDVNEKGGDAETADKPWVKALKIGTTLLSGGIQGVYGGKREYPKINWGKKAEVKDDTEDILKPNTTDEFIVKDGVKVANPDYEA